MAMLWILVLPALAALASLLPLDRRFGAVATIVASLAGTILSAMLVARVVSEGPVTAIADWIACDALSAAILLLVSFVGLAAALFSWGYMDRVAPTARSGRIRRYYAGFNLFLLSILAIPLLTEVAMVWIAVALTTLLSAFLVSFHGTPEALEAAWKYVVLTSLGAIIALFGVFVLYWAASSAGIEEFSWPALTRGAPELAPPLVATAFLFILIGFGTKVGLVPMHVWLPDAYSQAPLPVCILLSGAEAAATLYVLLKLLPLCAAASVDVQGWAIGFGLLTTGFAVLLLLRARHIKRLLAFSTIEHMGIILVAAGLGSSDANLGALYQLGSHALAKSFCFMAAGLAILATGAREIDDIRGLVRSSPVAGVSLLAGGLAISGAPPFAVFLGEMSIVKAGLEADHYVAIGLLVLFIAVGFCAVMMRINRMVFGDPTTTEKSPRLPASPVAALALVAVPLVVAGIYLPDLALQVVHAATTTLGGPQ